MSRRLKRRGPGGRTRLDSTVGSRPMIQACRGEQFSVACIPRVAVESSHRGVAIRTPSRRCPEQRDAMDARSSSCVMASPWTAGH